VGVHAGGEPGQSAAKEIDTTGGVGRRSRPAQAWHGGALRLPQRARPGN